MGGIGGPSTLRVSAGQKAKKKAHFAGELLGKGDARKDSDVSFRCAGDRSEGGKWEDREYVPSPLFSGPRRTREEREGSRDTKFYQPYVEVLHEYDGGRH